MQFLDVFRAMVLALRAPWRVADYVDRRATTFFAVAVLCVTAVNVVATLNTQADAQLSAEAALLTPKPEASGGVDLRQSGRQVTAILGGAVFTTSMSIIVLAGLMMVVGRFLTDQPYRYGHAIIVTSGASAIVMLRVVVETSLQLATHSVRWGPHLGIVVDPSASPYVFAALQRVDVFTLWEYVVIAIGLVRTQGLHDRFGYVIGLVVWLLMIILFSGATTVASVLAKAS
ncbi:MAG: hypothetical protein FGM24_00995 [Candidatus Kapabacteria bacterium]|nr:hypothetical protein [Candidatus Kapabacteria bacterium]